MTWQDGDWKVQAPPTGDWGQRSVTGSLAANGFTPWDV